MPPRRRGRARGRAHARRGRVGRNGRAEGSDVEQSNREDAEVSQSANSDGHGASNMTLTQWLDMKLDKFDGSGTPMDAASWLRSMEKYMDASVMTQEDKVVYVAFQLKGLADIWWEGVRAAWTPAHGPPTWDVFVKQFTSKYYPNSFKEKMDVALRNIKQGDKTVDEYEMEFSKIVHFVDHINQNEGEKARRFFEGLNSEYRHVMGANRPNEYFSVVEQARGMELQIQLTQAETARTGGTSGSSSKHKRNHLDGSEITERLAPKKSKQDGQSQLVSRPRSQFSSGTKFMRPAPGQGLMCFKCGQNHRASECDFSGNCNQCGKSGHMRVVCKENPDSIIKWQVITPSTEISSKGGSSHTANSGYVSSHGSVQMMAVPPNHPSPPAGCYWQATPLPSPYAPLPLPAPTNIPPQHMSVGDSSTLTRSGIYTTPPTSSHDHSDGVRGINHIPIYLRS
ncbi:hypothetical protein QYE76_064774 [Lolium multiflorum]|uniref:CCHC-type domain-containing protein n=1 Tax=Lolium multiflorum TaxID=4521 RepID=A0AAD8WAA4_LOLMU|nr:hypothetical protein QYE76_064774 [Lolium multiflorum]